MNGRGLQGKMITCEDCDPSEGPDKLNNNGGSFCFLEFFLSFSVNFWGLLSFPSGWFSQILRTSSFPVATHRIDRLNPATLKQSICNRCLILWRRHALL